MKLIEYKQFIEEEILTLYSSVGWTAYTQEPDALRRGFEHSLLILAAYEEDELIGLIRAVGDGCTIVLVQDLLVRPAHQRKGVGTALLEEVLKRFAHVRQIELCTDQTPETLAFYRKAGFRLMTELGCCGMMR